MKIAGVGGGGIYGFAICERSGSVIHIEFFSICQCFDLVSILCLSFFVFHYINIK